MKPKIKKIDTRIRPWNSHNTRDRANGQYYEAFWTHAIEAGANIVSVTSYNEWGEGTQIETAAMASERDIYKRYSDPYQYLNLTAKMSSEFRRRRAEVLSGEGSEHDAATARQMQDEL